MSQQEMGRKQGQQVADQGLFKVPQPPLMVSLSNHPLPAMTAGRQLHVGSSHGTHNLRHRPAARPLPYVHIGGGGLAGGAEVTETRRIC